MELYIVDFEYYDTYEKQSLQDRWTLACKNEEELKNVMDKNFKEFERCGYKPNKYSFVRVNTTDNGFKIIVENNK